MIPRLWLFGLILGLPLFGFSVAEGIKAYSNSEFHDELRKQYPEADEAKISSISIDNLCEENSSAVKDICETNANLSLLSRASFGAGFVGLLLLACIWCAGFLARNNRTILLLVFRPGLYLTATVLIGLVLVHAGIAMGAIYYGESALIHRVHIFVIGAIGFGAIIGVFTIARNTFSLIRNAQTFVIGKTVSRVEAPTLWARIEGLSKNLGALCPQNIVLGLDPNFFVTEADVRCLAGNCSGRTLYCSLPLMRILSDREFDAVIGHELGHFKGFDTKFSLEFYPIFRGTANSISALSQTGSDGDGTGAIALLPAIAVFGYFLESFSIAESRISRERELLADKHGASLSDSSTMAVSLLKIHAFGGHWSGLEKAIVEALKSGNMCINASTVYVKASSSNANLEIFESIVDSHTSHPTDSHPSLGIRLASLGFSVKEISDRALVVSPENPALKFILDPESLEESISYSYQYILAKSIGIDLESVPDAQEAN